MCIGREWDGPTINGGVHGVSGYKPFCRRVILAEIVYLIGNGLETNENKYGNCRNDDINSAKVN